MCAAVARALPELPLKRYRNLVLLRGGDRSFHPTFFSGLGRQEPTWDLHISYFGKSSPFVNEGVACSCTHDGGSGKFESIHDLVDRRKLDLSGYDYIAFPDDDLIITGPQWNALFDIARRYDLEVAGVSLNPFGYWEFPHMLSQPGLLLRFTNHIEPFALIFRRDVFEKVFPYFKMKGIAWGIEHIVGHIRSHDRAVAIIDAVDVFHTRMQRTGELYGGVKRVDEVFLAETQDLLKSLGLTPQTPKVSGAIDRRGRDVPPADVYRLLRPFLRGMRKWRTLTKVTTLAIMQEGQVLMRAPYPVSYRHAKIRPTLS